MSWFFASSASFTNGNSETVTNSPINLDLISTYGKTTATPVGTTETLFAISFAVTSPSTTLYLYYVDEVSRDADFDLLEAQLALSVATKAGWHTASGFTNDSGQVITNKDINLDFISTYSKTSAKPEFTSLFLHAIAFVSTNKHHSEYLYYEDETARDLDYDTIQATIAAVSTVISSNLVLTPNYALITTTLLAGWVIRDLGVGANKVCQIKIARQGSGDTYCYAGAREVGSSEPYEVMDIWDNRFKMIQTDANGNIEIFATSYVNFYLTHTLSIE